LSEGSHAKRADFRQRVVYRLLSARANGYGGALRRELPRDRPPNTVAAAGDDDHLPL
jgi:hypothetical protein